MKKIFIYFTFLVIISSCTPKKTIQYPYNVILIGTTLNNYGSGLQQETKEDTVMAENDTVAYERGLISFVASRSTKQRLGMGDVISYKIVDSIGNNLDITLSEETIDSLKKFYTSKPKYKNIFVH